MGIEIATWIITIIFVFLVFKMILPGRGVLQINSLEARERLQDKDVQCIDVRTEVQFSQVRISGFKNIPLRDLKKRLNELAPDKKVVVLCQTGARSNIACKRLKRQGFKDLENVKGGLSVWQ